VVGFKHSIRLTMQNRVTLRLRVTLRPKHASYRGLRYPDRHFDLLKVCRQVYTETKLLPFTLNTFWGTTEGLHFALKNPVVGPDQANAIRELLVRIRERDFKTQPVRMKELPLMELLHLMQELHGLKRVYICWHGSAPPPIPDCYREVVEGECAKVLVGRGCELVMLEEKP
jgi:hypothetical protein